MTKRADSARSTSWWMWLLLAVAVLGALALLQGWRELSQNREEAAELAVDRALGATLEELDEDLADDLGVSASSGLVVTSLGEGRAADRAGLHPGDVIEQIGPFAVPDAEAAAEALRADRHRRLDLLISRSGKELHVVIDREPATGQWLLVLETLQETAR